MALAGPRFGVADRATGNVPAVANHRFFTEDQFVFSAEHEDGLVDAAANQFREERVGFVTRTVDEIHDGARVAFGLLFLVSLCEGCHGHGDEGER